MLDNAKVYKILVESMNFYDEKKLAEIIGQFVKRGFDINYAPENTPSLLQIAISHNYNNLFLYMIKNGANYNVDLAWVDLMSYEYNDNEFPKIADYLIERENWDLLKVIIDDCELCLDGSLYKIFDNALTYYKLSYDKKFFNSIYKDIFQEKEIPSIMDGFKNDYKKTVEILQRLCKRFDIALDDYVLFESCTPLDQDAIILKWLCAPVDTHISVDKLNRLPKNEKNERKQYYKDYEIIMNDICKTNQNDKEMQ